MICTFSDLYEENGDAEAYGLAQLLRTYKFVACLYMLCDVLHNVAKLQGLQSKQIDLAAVPIMDESTLSRLREWKETPSSSTCFKDHTSVFTEVAESEVSYAVRDNFTKAVYRPYIQGVIDHISSRLKASDTFSAFSLVIHRSRKITCRHMAQRHSRL